MDTNPNSRDADEDGGRLTRRGSLVRLGGAAATMLGASAWKLESAHDAGAAGTGPAASGSGSRQLRADS